MTPAEGPAQPEPLLRATALGHRFGPRHVLRGIDLAMRPGERVALRGDNGSGKSTLLRILAGILRPTEGAVAIAGRDPRRDAKARASIGCVLHEPGLYPEWSPDEHVAWWLRAHGLPLEPRTTLLDAAGLRRVAHEPCGRLSRGQRQRVALAMALAPSPKVLLLDEPFTALDAAGRDWLAHELDALQPTTAILFTTHGDELAGTTTTRSLRLGGGVLEAA